MENSIGEISNYLRDLQKRYIISIIDSHIYLNNVSFDLFSDVLDNDLNQNLLSFILYLVNTIIEKTESTIILNVLFKDTISDINKIQFKQIERIFNLFYSFAPLTKFIENKEFYVRFPQITLNSNFNLVEEIKSNILTDEVILIDVSENNGNNILEDISDIIQENVKIENTNRKKFYYFGQEEFKQYTKETDKETIENRKLLLIKEMKCIEKHVESREDNLYVLNYDFVALGGSFDHNHIGHNMLLATAAFLTRKIIRIGVTSSEMIKHKAKEFILQPFQVREANARRSLEKMGVTCEINIHTLHNVTGQAGTNNQVQALILTHETLKGGLMVNQERVNNNLPEIPLVAANLINDCNILPEEQACKISSTFMRNKMINEISIEHLEQLYHHWSKLTIKVLRCPFEISKNWFSQIRDLYMQSWRKYHTLNHILCFVNLADSYFQHGKIKDYVNVLLSIWFHDVIYTPSRQDNEERSVENFIAFYEDIKRGLVLENTVDLIDLDKVIKYIMATKKHFSDDTYDDNDLNYFLDFDLFTFSIQDLEKYLSISETIKYEYSHHLAPEEWKEGRKRFLTSVIEKKNIYRTQEFINNFENIARRNILKEIEILYNN